MKGTNTARVAITETSCTTSPLPKVAAGLRRSTRNGAHSSVPNPSGRSGRRPGFGGGVHAAPPGGGAVAVAGGGVPRRRVALAPGGGTGGAGGGCPGGGSGWPTAAGMGCAEAARRAPHPPRAAPPGACQS